VATTKKKEIVMTINIMIMIKEASLVAINSRMVIKGGGCDDRCGWW